MKTAGIEGDLSAPLLGSKSVQDLTTENNCHETSTGIASYAQDEEGLHTNNSADRQLLNKGYLDYGCTHFRRRCRIRAPCCNEIFGCRRCHDESKDNLDKDRHKVPWKEIHQVICSLCNTEQEVQQICINCGVCMGRYFCEICKIFIDDTSKKVWHCLSCGICRRGNHQFSHCNTCQCCRAGTHTCIEGVLHRNCPICFEYLFETPGPFSGLPCGHIIHHSCFLKLKQNSCPICSKPFTDMSEINTTWRLQLHRFLRIFKTN